MANKIQTKKWMLEEENSISRATDQEVLFC
jgi:hypothetical protein